MFRDIQPIGDSVDRIFNVENPLIEQRHHDLTIFGIVRETYHR